MFDRNFLPETLHPAAKELAGVFAAAGKECYFVGGCVRDALLGKFPWDYDLCTPLKPEETLALFKGYRTIPTGLKHGTVTVLVDGIPFEITTFRVDGDYPDGRHPAAVSFTDDLTLDLSRRDFTVNAIAWSPERGYVDPFGGMLDLEQGVIRCVREPDLRFREDALRILRGLRFSSQLGFPIEEATDAALRSLAPTLAKISRERVLAELKKLLLGKDADRVVDEYPEVFAFVLPPFCARETALRALPERLPLRFAALLGENTEEALRDLKADNALIEDAALLAREIPCALPSSKEATHRLLAVFGRERPPLFSDYLAYRFACGDREEELRRVLDWEDALRLEKAPLSVRELALSGGDLLPLGYTGVTIGKTLSALFEAVVRGEVPNEKEALLSYLQK